VSTMAGESHSMRARVLPKLRLANLDQGGDRSKPTIGGLQKKVALQTSNATPSLTDSGKLPEGSHLLVVGRTPNRPTQYFGNPVALIILAIAFAMSSASSAGNIRSTGIRMLVAIDETNVRALRVGDLVAVFISLIGSRNL
jgi:hypothetical protein